MSTFDIGQFQFEIKEDLFGLGYKRLDVGNLFGTTKESGGQNSVKESPAASLLFPMMSGANEKKINKKGFTGQVNIHFEILYFLFRKCFIGIFYCFLNVLISYFFNKKLKIRVIFGFKFYDRLIKKFEILKMIEQLIFFKYIILLGVWSWRF